MYDGPIIDCDVHYAQKRPDDLVAYLPKEWQEFVKLPGEGRTTALQAPTMIIHNPDGTNRLDAVPASGGPPGSDHQTLCEQLLDPFRVEHAMLISVGAPGLPNGDLAHALCRANNDWTRDVWLDGTGDDRLNGSVMTAMHYPEQAAEEIRRVGQDDRFVSVYLVHGALGKPFGHPVYHPIFEAAAELGLPVFTHVSGGEFFGSSGNFVAGGDHHHYRYDVFMAAQQSTMSHVTSMIVHGVFEKYPALTYLMAEPGVSWLPWLATRLEANHELMKTESAWVKKRPSEYLHDHGAITTQPCEATAENRQQFVEDMSLVDGIEDMLVFSSDYPHWDNDDPDYIGAILPKAWHDKVFYENAARVLRLPAKSKTRRPAAAVPA
jgi:predicted TIM-barrel fold metal-dependent hydrolase